MFGTEALGQVEAQLAALVGALEPGALSPEAAARHVEHFARIERLASAGKTLAAGRVAECDDWRRHGDRSAAHWLARQSGSTIGEALGTLATAQRLTDLPETDAVLRQGRLSRAQANEVADAAVVDPTAESALLETAARDSVMALREHARRVKAAACPDDETRHRRIHASRYLRKRTDAEGAFCMELRTTPDAGAELWNALAPFREQVFRAARAEGRRESLESYAADAIVEMGRAASGADTTSARGRRSKVIVRIDHDALLRGHTHPGETCEIAGVGPVPVSVVERMLGDSFLAAVVTKGRDVLTVAHLGRNPTSFQLTALEWLGTTCSVLGCDSADHLEIDHVAPWAATHRTLLPDLAFVCRYHHNAKTHHGFDFEAGTGRRRFVPPEEADEPLGSDEPQRTLTTTRAP
jgi:hypothetical protein